MEAEKLFEEENGADPDVTTLEQTGAAHRRRRQTAIARLHTVLQTTGYKLAFRNLTVARAETIAETISQPTNIATTIKKVIPGEVVVTGVEVDSSVDVALPDGAVCKHTGASTDKSLTCDGKECLGPGQVACTETVTCTCQDSKSGSNFTWVVGLVIGLLVVMALATFFVIYKLKASQLPLRD